MTVYTNLLTPPRKQFKISDPTRSRGNEPCRLPPPLFRLPSLVSHLASFLLTGHRFSALMLFSVFSVSSVRNSTWGIAPLVSRPASLPLSLNEIYPLRALFFLHPSLSETYPLGP